MHKAEPLQNSMNIRFFKSLKTKKTYPGRFKKSLKSWLRCLQQLHSFPPSWNKGCITQARFSTVKTSMLARIIKKYSQLIQFTWKKVIILPMKDLVDNISRKWSYRLSNWRSNHTRPSTKSIHRLVNVNLSNKFEILQTSHEKFLRRALNRHWASHDCKRQFEIHLKWNRNSQRTLDKIVDSSLSRTKWNGFKDLFDHSKISPVSWFSAE